MFVVSSPPSSPPKTAPPPPPDEGEASTTDPLLPQSYQSTGGSRAAAPPTIRHYDERDVGQQQQLQQSDDVRDFFFVRGDATLTPNTGETNSYDTAIFGLALHELLENVRLANMIAALVAVGLLITSWFLRMLQGQVAKVVLSSYLAFLSVVLMLVEVVGMWHFVAADQFIKRNFGIVRHPLGKTIYIYLLSTICFGINCIPEFVLGSLYFICASLLLYVWCSYPEFRRQFATEDEDDENETTDPRRMMQSVTWSSVTSSSFFNRASAAVASGKSLGETASLLGSSRNK